jgi:hypothetical protein
MCHVVASAPWRRRRAQASLIREALERYLAGQERPLPASIGAASDGTLDAAESEAWLHKEWRRGSPAVGPTEAGQSKQKATRSRP